MNMISASAAASATASLPFDQDAEAAASILTPNPQPLEATYRNDFVGMTRDEVGLEALEETRIWLFEELPKSLTRTERDFLIGLKAGEPDWSLLPFPSLQHMPAVRWKLENIRRLKQSNPRKHADLLARLEEKLGL